jgi:hypothetical protein
MQVKEIHTRFTIARSVPSKRIFGPFDFKHSEINGGGRFVVSS